MKKTLVIVSLFLSLNVIAQSEHTDWKLITHGAYHGADAPSKPGSGWLALVAVGGVWRLEPAIVNATRANDPLLDAEDEKTGIDISSNYSEAIALLRLPNIRVGKVNAPNIKFTGNPELGDLSKESIEIKFKNENYSIFVKDSLVFLKNGGTTSQFSGLAIEGEEGEAYASLAWAGDLDGDGKLDFMFNRSGHNSGGICLYMSYAIGTGSPMEPVACHDATGC